MNGIVERVLTALYAREPAIKVVLAATGGGTSASDLLFRAGSSSTMLQFTVPYARASLQRFLSDGERLASASTQQQPLPKFCSKEMAERMAVSAWHQANQILSEQAEDDDDANPSHSVRRFRSAVGVGCTAALATNYDRRGVNQAFISICRVHHSPSRAVDQRICESYHLHLDKSLRRSRQEEDRLVSQYIVYLLAKTANVDTEGCDALRDAIQTQLQGADDRFEAIVTDDDSNISVQDAVASLASTELSSVAFIPSPSDDGASTTTTIVRDLPFKGIVLSGSFNPLHRGHVDLALASQRLLKDKLHKTLPIAFELAVANADKGTIPVETVLERVRQFTSDATTGLGNWPVLTTNATLFSQKAELFKDSVFVIGADTAMRLVDKKYYGMDEHRMVLVLERMARNGCSFVVAGRFDDKQAGRFISAEEVLNDHIPPMLQHLFLALREDDFRSDLSSTQLRNNGNGIR